MYKRQLHDWSYYLTLDGDEIDAEREMCIRDSWSSKGTYSDIQPLTSSSVWNMYDYGDHRVVSGNYLKCSNLSLTYEFKEDILKKMRLSRLDLTLSATNLFTVSAKELKGQTPTQGGFATIQLSDRPTRCV